MGFSLLDRSFEFSALIHAQYARLSDAVSLLRDAFEDKPGVADALKRIQAIEAEARRVSREITRQLSLTMIRPIEREDIHDLNQAFERAITAVKAVSTRIGLYGVRSMPGSAKEVGGCLGEVCEMRLSGLDTVLDIVKWGQIYDRLEDAVDRIEDVANVIEGMVLKNV